MMPEADPYAPTQDLELDTESASSGGFLQGAAEWWSTAGDAANALGAGLNRGAVQVQDNYNTAWLANRPDIDDSERLRLLRSGPMAAFMDEQGKVNQEAYENSLPAIQLLRDTASSLPAMGNALAQGYVASKAADVISSPLLSLTSRLPAQAAALTGAGVLLAKGAAFDAGAWQANWTQYYGEMYRSLRLDHGAQHDHAQKIATTYAAAQAGLDLIGLKSTTKYMGNVFAKRFKEDLVKRAAHPMVQRVTKNAVAQTVFDYGENILTEGITEYGQQFLTDVAEFNLAYWEKADPGEFSWANSHKDAAGAFIQGVLQAALISGAGGTAAHYAAKGKVSLMSDPKIAAYLEKLTPGKLAQNLRDSMNDAKAYWEGEDDQKVHVTEDGKVLITTGATKTEAPSMNTTAKQVSSEIPQTGLFAEPKTPKTKTANVSAEEAQQAGLDAVYPTVAQDGAPTPEELMGARELTPLEGTGEPLTKVETQARRNQISADMRLLRKEQVRLEIEFKQKDKTGKKTTRTLGKLEAVLQATEELAFERELLDSGLLTQEDVASESGQLRMSKLHTLTAAIEKSGKRLEAFKQKYKDKVALLDRTGKEKVAAEKEKGNAKADKAKAAGLKAGAKQENRTVKTMQNQLKALVNSQIKNPGARARINNYINGATTVTNIRKAAEKITKAIEKHTEEKKRAAYEKARDAVLGQIDNLLKNGTTKTVGGKPVQVKLPVDAANRLKAFAGYLKNSDAANAIVYNQLLNAENTDGIINPETKKTATYADLLYAGDGHKIPLPVLEQLDLLTTAIGLRNQDLMTLNIIKGELAQFVMDGKDAIARKQEKLRQQRLDEVATAYQSLGANEENIPEGLPTNKKAADAKLATYMADGLSWRDLMLYMTTGRDNALADLVDTTVQENTFHAGVDIQVSVSTDMMNQALADAGITTPIKQIVHDASSTKLQLRYMGADGKYRGDNPEAPVIYTKAQLIDAWMKMQDTELHATMRDIKTGNGWTLEGDLLDDGTGEMTPVEDGESFQEVVEAALSPEDKVVARAILNYYDKYHARVNEWYREKYGADLPKRDNYSPLNRKNLEVTPGTQAYHNLLYSSLLPGSAKTRVDSLKAIQLDNAFSMLDGHVKDWEHAIAFDDVMGTARNVFGDSLVRKHIESKFGAGTLQMVDDYIGRFIANEPLGHETDDLGKAFRADMAAFALGLKAPYQVVLQMTSGTAMWTNYSNAEISKGALAYIKNFKETEAAFRADPTLRYRFREGASFDLQTAMHNGGFALKALEPLLQKMGFDGLEASPEQVQAYQALMFAGIRYGDAGVVRVFGGPVYHAELAKGKSPKEAMMAVVRLVEETQQSDAVSQMPSRWARNPWLYTMLGQFTLQANQIAGKVHQTNRDAGAKLLAIKNKRASAGAKSKAALGEIYAWGRKVALLSLIPGAAVGVLKTLPMWMAPPSVDDDDEEYRRKETVREIAHDTVLNTANANPVLGIAYEALWWLSQQAIFGDASAPQAIGRTSIGGKVDAFIEAGQAIQSAMKEPDAKVSGPIGEEDDKQAEKVDKAVRKSIRAGFGALGLPERGAGIPLDVGRALEAEDPLGAAIAASGLSSSMTKRRYGDGKNPKAESGPIGEEVEHVSLYDSLNARFKELQSEEDAQAQEDALATERDAISRDTTASED
jgi:hypothetical protein